MSVVKEFKEFATKGNVMDLAVAVVIGAAFGGIIASLVNDMIMPLIGIITGGHDFSSLAFKINSVDIHYGKILNAVVNFMIIAFCLFMVVKTINKLKKKKEEAPVAPVISNEEKLLMEIRDLLKK